MIPLLDAKNYTVIRRGVVEYVNGLPQPATPDVTLTIRASIQPMRAYDLVRAPEGLRATRGIKIYAGLEAELRTTQAGAQYADLVEYQGELYEVHQPDVYGAGAPLPHGRYEAWASETARSYPRSPAP